MKKIIRGTLFLTMAMACGFVGADSLRNCMQPNNGVLPDSMPWLPNGANQNACNQMMISSALQVTNASDSSDGVAAFKDGKLAGMRDRSLRMAKPVLMDPSAWQESADTGRLGELWWGRTGDWHVFAGQESHVRLAQGAAALSQSEMAQRLAELKRQMDALKNKQPPPAPLPVVADSGLFRQRTMEYRQIGGTRTSFKGGLGGEGDIPSGKVSNARLKLETAPTLKGVLSFDLDVDGTTRTFSFPVMANTSRKDNRSFASPEEKYRLRGAAVVNGEYYRCSERPNAAKPYAGAACEFADVPFKEDYEAYGAFFGDHGALAAIHFRLTVNSPSRNRTGAVATGIIVMQSATAASVQ